MSSKDKELHDSLDKQILEAFSQLSEKDKLSFLDKFNKELERHSNQGK